MGHRIDTQTFRTREEAEEHQNRKGIQGYSEVYKKGIVEVTLVDGTTYYTSTTEEYYG